jgi:cytochrome c biogenesis protein CcmG/thiol:disulfide interchange protein DsbE
MQIETVERPRRLHLAFLLPAVLFIGFVLTFIFGLGHDPRIVPSPLIGKPVPAFRLPPVKGRALGLSSADLWGGASLVNVFASWCVACRDEHPVLMWLKAQRIVPIYGLDYKDEPDDAAHWLDAMGRPLQLQILNQTILPLSARLRAPGPAASGGAR